MHNNISAINNASKNVLGLEVMSLHNITQWLAAKTPGRVIVAHSSEDVEFQRLQSYYQSRNALLPF